MKDDETLMKIYGIQSSTKTIYHYQNHRYDNLRDAINFAKIDVKRHRPSSLASNTEAAPDLYEVKE